MRIKFRGLGSLLLLLLSLLSLARTQTTTQTFQLSQVSVENKTVDAVGNFEFMMQIRRAPLGQEQVRVEYGDYLIIEIPTLTTSARWDTSRAPVCVISTADADSQLPPSVAPVPEDEMCLIQSKSKAKIVLME